MKELKAVVEMVSLGCVCSGTDYMNVGVTAEENISILMHDDMGETVERIERQLTPEQTAAFTDKIMQLLLSMYQNTGVMGNMVERIVHDEINDIDLRIGHDVEEQEVLIELNGTGVILVLEQIEKIMDLIQKDRVKGNISFN
ncbi:hypothetical protein BI004_gp283 [Bacillus phage NotTheCreek]|uniref:Uncharacterized protein n=3 Tax=Wphvirus TaxID=1922327 RepID=A0A222Z2P0_9CAUD|nr:hypothetical protein FP72_gp283 [Bacillus phage Hakuna]YP_009279458.1 hypothetical protein BIZ89_gp291 [Bacillus phage Kida]YP_009281090.1 hypothetical protein SAGEFAYGE_287 [Bacillus phage SageFayge]YP_009284611.1 hypothetical protein BI004_gp283 [Bacillus phage NotTheCreek]YP_009287165.1 hypothetical protein BI006_gp289 [Bacillus phage Nemo]ASR78227.1 hypothetical protein PPISBEST_288 [Bacillus phage PPIsBest]ASR78504.1 hypothetical protein BUBS_290 [Bacillus phage Bubs]AXQ67390.1 hypot